MDDALSERFPIMTFSRRTFTCTAASLAATLTSQRDIAVNAAEATPSSEDMLVEIMAQTGVPGLGLLVTDGQGGSTVTTHGMANLESGTPMDAAMPFRIGSITKTLTATIVLQLVDEGKLSLDATLADVYSPAAGLPNASEITVEQLLTMSSGLPEYTDTDQAAEIFAHGTSADYATEDILSWLEGAPETFAPGSAGEYCNTGYLLLGEIVAKAGGSTFAEQVASRIANPLELTHTFVPDTAQLPDGAMMGYSWANYLATREAATPDASPAMAADATPTANWSNTEATPDFSPTVSAGAGNVISTLGELDTVLRAVVGGTLLPADLHAMQMDFATRVDPFMYGMGLLSINGLVGHTGGITGFSTAMFANPANGKRMTLVTNAMPYKDGSAVSVYIKALADQIA